MINCSQHAVDCCHNLDFAAVITTLFVLQLNSTQLPCCLLFFWYVLTMVAEKNLPAVIIRFSMVYGPGDVRDILKLTRLAKKGLFPKIGNRPKLTPLIHVDDAVEGLLLAADNGYFIVGSKIRIK